jgi:uncharacterized protein YndB with AHSA1/START domain
VATATAAGPDGKPALDAVTTVTLVDHDGKTELTVHERAVSLIPEAAMMLAGMEVGLLQSLRRLDDLVTGSIERQIVLTRMLEVPRERVFEAWTRPEHVQRWWGPNGFTITIDEMDVRPGGTWRYTMHGPDGVDYPNLMTFRDVVPSELLTYEHRGDPDDDEPPFHGSVSFDDFMGNTILTMRVVFASTEDLDRNVAKYGAIEGGNQTLDRLVAYVTTL